MSSVDSHSLKVLEKTFKGLLKEELEAIRIFLSRLAVIREYKKDFTTLYIDGLRSKDKLKRYMVIYLAISILFQKQNRRDLKHWDNLDFQGYNRRLYRKMLKINELSYDHFKNVSNFDNTLDKRFL